MTEITIDDLAEQLVRHAADALTESLPHECLLCYLARMLEEFRCDGTPRFAPRFRDRAAPAASERARPLGAAGASCDCAIFLDGWSPHPSLWSPARTEVEHGVSYRTDPEPPAVLPACPGARPDSPQCALWVRRGRVRR